jgi:hypothetical protein
MSATGISPTTAEQNISIHRNYRLMIIADIASISLHNKRISLFYTYNLGNISNYYLVFS